MTLYRVHFRDDDSSSLGFAWFTSLRAAETARKAQRHDPGAGCECLVEVVTGIPITRAGLVQALNAWGSHPDNG